MDKLLEAEGLPNLNPDVENWVDQQTANSRIHTHPNNSWQWKALGPIILLMNSAKNQSDLASILFKLFRKLKGEHFLTCSWGHHCSTLRPDKSHTWKLSIHYRHVCESYQQNVPIRTQQQINKITRTGISFSSTRIVNHAKLVSGPC